MARTRRRKTTRVTPPAARGQRPAPSVSGGRAQAAPARPAARSKLAPRDFPIVVIGASAGGLDAFKRFLSAAPSDTGMAFVLIPHLDPARQSKMAELLAKHTEMAVHEAVHGMRIKPNRVYLIPPKWYLAIERGVFELSEPPARRGVHTAIDFALHSLAEDRREAAVGIILSGTGSHGVLGVKEIKLAGGMVFVQDPATAEYDEMPRSAIATGVVDQVLAPERMPEALLRCRHVAQRRPAPDAESADVHDGVKRVLALLQARTKHDFRRYRRNMVTRRIRRRMALLQIVDWQDYVEHLRDNPGELAALRNDLLIGVTSFFRDPDALAALAEYVLPNLAAGAGAETPVRVWVPGCATGEEAYSIAILLIEQFRAADKPVSMQIFATDVDERSLEIARQGIYPDSIAAAVSPERVKQFFVKLDDHRYQVSKELRESIVVAPQNLLADAPFSKLDLISCRNVLIYLEPDVQERVVSLLHFALNDGGYLLLGPSESIGRATGMFVPVAKNTKLRLYRRVGSVRRDLIGIPITAAANEGRPRRALPEAARPAPAKLAQAMQRLLAEDFAPASALINRELEILAMQGPLVNYLEFPAGEMTRDLLSLARQGLRLRIRTACAKALREGHAVSDDDLRVRRNGRYVPCRLTVRPIAEQSDTEGLLLVVFQDRVEAVPEGPRRTAADESVVKQLEDELRATREDLQSTIKELESSNEELKVSNQEIMSMNEELQSTNEELETSKEELQSLNEELATVNNQLQDKVEDLDAANNDLTNLMGATDIATIFLDTELRIKRFTPPTSKLLNVIGTDVGRAFRDFAPRFKDDDLLRDAESVLKASPSSEKVVCTDDARWYLRRILPYRAGDDRIGGVVITFVDITERTEAEAQARRLASVLRDSNDAVIICGLDGRITGWNRGAERMYGYTEAEALGLSMCDLLPEDRKGSVAALAERVARGEDVQAFEAKRRARDGRELDVGVTVTPLTDEKGAAVAIARTERDITARRQRDEEIRSLNATLEQRVAERTVELRESEYRFRSVVGAAVDAIVTINRDGRIETFNPAAERMFGYTAEEAIGRSIGMLMPSPHRENHGEYLRRYRETGERRVIGRTRDLNGRRKDGSEFPIQLSVSEIAHLDLFMGIVRDVTEHKALQEEIVRIATLEQRRIGHELHDGTQQELTGLGLLAQSLSESLAETGGKQGELAAKLAAGIAAANRNVRALAQGLVPVAVDAEGLMQALAGLAASTQESYGIRCRFECPAPVELDNDVTATHLYRIAQEAVANAVKHAKAATITIELVKAGGTLELAVEDDGAGIAKQLPAHKGLGLRIMRYRCALMGGELAVERQDAGGTRVSCTLDTTDEARHAADRRHA